jgi:hypothetical protein
MRLARLLCAIEPSHEQGEPAAAALPDAEVLVSPEARHEGGVSAIVLVELVRPGTGEARQRAMTEFAGKPCVTVRGILHRR